MHRTLVLAVVSDASFKVKNPQEINAKKTLTKLVIMLLKGRWVVGGRHSRTTRPPRLLVGVGLGHADRPG